MNKHKLQGVSFSYKAIWDGGAGKESGITDDVESVMERIVTRERTQINWTFSSEQMEHRAEVVRDAIQDNLTLAAFIQMNCWFDDWEKVLLTDFQTPVASENLHDFLIIVTYEELWMQFESEKITINDLEEKLESVYHVLQRTNFVGEK